MEKRVANSKKVIIENIALDLGITAKEFQKFLIEQLDSKLGTNHGVVIVDIDMNISPTSVSVSVLELDMVEKIKKLDGINCIGETMRVRKVGEDSEQINA